ncbi:hypothetical protein [Prauserella muralis]|uniref:Uncharacterized protein n=1 Tax=Prauserella muralis TaxID=588067 RepID=A0A2V4ALF5_9PSEU|nr:hypothetical protein [Prauserella muralis]PXY21125.1 hypothetical protein BAY60_27040 [Prauserella muralis]TWE30213.1 hypothetical protein FHX69_2910 [Prauserella muralis]
MASVSALRDGIGVRLKTISGLNVLSRPGGNVITPAARVMPTRILYDSTMSRGADDFLFAVLLLVSLTADIEAYDDLDAYLAGSGPTSVKAAIEADGSLGGIADFARVREVTQYGWVEVDGVQYLGAEQIVEVTASGS